MTLDELESAWAALQAPNVPGAIAGRRAAGLAAEQAIYLAVDSRRYRHLLVGVPEGSPPVVEPETRSLEVVTARFQVGENPEATYVDLACTDMAQHSTFSAIAQDLLRACRQSKTPARDQVLATLARWRSFWANRKAPLTREEATGLFGELWFMRRWLGVSGGSKWRGWQATEGARHDFQWPQLSVEVKTASTQSGSAPIHRIASVDQLAFPEQGELFLFSLQVCEDALASNTLHALAVAIAGDFENSGQGLEDFNARLAARGYSAGDGQNALRPLRVLGERLYKVDDRFPRVVRESFGPEGAPNGVISLSYELDLAVCESWLVARRPEEAAAILSRLNL